MSQAKNQIEPVDVVEAVEQYVFSELRDAEKFSNRNPLDESGIFSLHALAANIYALGWGDGERATERRNQRTWNRASEAARRDREALFAQKNPTETE